MSDERTATAKGEFDAVVSSNKQIGVHFYKLRLEFSGAGAEAFDGFGPGQFVQLDVSGAALPAVEQIPEHLKDAAGRKILLRRPFSFTDVARDGDKTVAELLYCVVGPATLRMTTLTVGDSVSVVGPLGNGFSVPEGKKKAFLVFGGMGMAPMQHLAKVLAWDEKERDIEVVAFAGAKSVHALPFEGRMDEISQQLGFSIREFAKYTIESMVATDDGSSGFHGLVTDCFLEWLKENKPSAEEAIIYSCGPEQMLARMAEIAKERNIDCQVSMERRMACGIGLCQSCAVECRVEGSNETIYKLCCEDGPMFDSKEVVFGS